MNGPTNYYVIDKVTAKKKILWIHNEFEKLNVNYDYERNYYEKADRVVTISQDCVDSFARVYPDLRKKALVLENISSPETIRNAAKLVPEDDFFQYEGLKIVSIGRLAPQKGYEIAIDAAAKIKKQGKKNSTPCSAAAFMAFSRIFRLDGEQTEAGEYRRIANIGSQQLQARVVTPYYGLSIDDIIHGTTVFR